ncbi:MAG: chemotaxis protein CheW [Nitrospinaceae bacterium]|nr:chemotaxis protein CheW [Nitrospinaceae bacterium]NIR53471.1 chemotaxis protein CheW [Nitrospinaceae bacterium]NIS83868.1 chemotaxis protein CheW [Nitrospinaceae bacterium]NIT80667.1 chemotaxis protein CheW [Nitrospinaceae bacterium]NIU42987.1 chemotaxis protein CheW [Nitrospinaceae bacterium]
MADEKQFCTFFVNNILFGVDVLDVQEVLRYQEMTNVPLAPKEINGLINLRGQIITAIDLRRRMNLPDRAEGLNPMNVVIRVSDEVVSFLVDKIGDVLELTDEKFEPAPGTVDSATRELVSGVYKLDGKLMMVLDAEKASNLNLGNE